MSDDSLIRKEGGPAFPVSIPGCGHNGWHGMHLRDYFAAKILPWCAAETKRQNDRFGTGMPMKFDLAAEDAYAMADAMLRARGPALTVKDQTGGAA